MATYGKAVPARQGKQSETLLDPKYVQADKPAMREDSTWLIGPEAFYGVGRPNGFQTI